ncbi:MAG: ABC transporter ATP-binding protein [bacterium]|nr:ABC transporter ATP-binding protein [bacterium]
MRGMSKSFGAVKANQDVDLGLRRGDILGLLGENGAGKTTLMNMLFGTYAPDSGEIEIEGRPVSITNSADALALGVGMVHQHFHLVPRLTVLDNLMIGRSGSRGHVDRAGARKRLAEIDDRFGLSLAPDTPVSELAIGEQQRLEIIKALFRDARILILDEPTAVLTPQEADALFEALRAMAGDGLGIIFISHKLYEVKAITNRAMIMRRGRVTATVDDVAAVSERELGSLMCGHEIVPPEKLPSDPGRALLSLRQVATNPDAAGSEGVPLREVSLEVRAGEVLGLAGVSGNGQLEVAEIIAGVRKQTRGELEVAGELVVYPNPRAIQDLRVGRIPEDRLGTGLISSLPMCDSMVLPRVHAAPFSRYGVLDRKKTRAFVQQQVERFDIKCAALDVRTGTLSGGNLQKVLLARELAFDPLVVLAAQPTRGLDVGAAQFVHERFLEVRESGGAILLISEDLEELFLLSDRIAVMYEGRVMDTLPIEEATVRRVGLLMAGVVSSSAAGSGDAA